MKEFLRWIDSYLAGEMTYKDFEDKVEHYYAVDEKSDSLPDKEAAFLNDVYEKTTYTEKDVPQNDKDRRYGIIDEVDFKKWLQQKKEENIKFWNQ